MSFSDIGGFAVSLGRAAMAAQSPLNGPSALPPVTLWEMFVRGWRPFGGWVCVLIMAVRGGVLPIVEMARGQPVSDFDWTGVVAILGALGFAALRSFDRAKGTA